MKVSVILAHPYEKSFNHGIYQQVIASFEARGAKVYAHDLYAEGFDPVLTRSELGKDPSTDELVNQYTNEMLDSKYLVFIHPNWWGQPPAMLKGYVDRVLRPPHAYDFPVDESGGGLPIEKLSDKYALIYNTSNTDADREDNYFGDPLQLIWEKCICGFCGINYVNRRMFRIIADSTLEMRKEWLNQVDSEVKALN